MIYFAYLGIGVVVLLALMGASFVVTLFHDAFKGY